MSKFAYCNTCHEWMRVYMNDITIKYSENVYINGDVYRCPVCFHKVVVRFGKPYTMTKEGEMREY